MMNMRIKKIKTSNSECWKCGKPYN